MKVWLIWERDEDIGQDSAIPVDIGFTHGEAMLLASEKRDDAERVQYAVLGVEVEPPKRGWR